MADCIYLFRPTDALKARMKARRLSSLRVKACAVCASTYVLDRVIFPAFVMPLGASAPARAVSAAAEAVYDKALHFLETIRDEEDCR